jgi:hypothetical protein
MRSIIVKIKMYMLVFAVIAFCQVSLASDKTFVIPHVLEKNGTISNTPFTFDTTIFADYTGSIGGGGAGGATVDFHLFDQATGLPMNANGNLGTIDLSSANPSASRIIEDCIDPLTGIKLGFGIIVVGGADPDNVALQGFVVNSHTGPLDLSVFGFDPQPINAPAAKAFVLPHVLEASGKTVIAGNAADVGGSTDTLLFPVYTGGLLGSPASSATMSITLFNDDSTRMTAGGAEIAPYEVTLSETNRSPLVSLEDIIGSGNFGGQEKQGYAEITISGDSSNVFLSGYVVNSHSGPFDLSFAPVPEPSIVALLLTGSAGLLVCIRKRRSMCERTGSRSATETVCRA